MGNEKNGRYRKYLKLVEYVVNTSIRKIKISDLMDRVVRLINAAWIFLVVYSSTKPHCPLTKIEGKS